MKVETSKKDIIWNYIGVFMSFGYGLVMLPFSVWFLDGDSLGLWYVFQSIGAIAVLMDFGFSPTFGRNINYCWSGARKLQKKGAVFAQDSNEPDFYLIKKVLNTCKIIYGIISSAALILLLTAGTFYVLHVTDYENTKIYITAWLIYAVAIFMNLYFGYYSSFLRGVGAVAENNKAVVFGRIIQIMLTIVLLFLGFGIIGCCVAYMAHGIIFRLIAKHKFYKYKDIGKKLKGVTQKIEKSEIKELFLTIWYNAWRDGLVQLSSYLMTQASTIICSMFLSLSETGVYSLALQVASVIVTVASAFFTTSIPAMQSAYVTKDSDKMRRTFSLSVVIYMLVSVAGIVGFIIAGIPLLKILKPDEVITIPLALGVCSSQFLIHFRKCYTSYFSCTNRLPYVRSLLVSSVFSIIIAVVLMGIFDLGTAGLIFSQIISQVVYNIWVWPIKVHKELELPFFKMPEIAVKTVKRKLRTGAENDE